MCSSHRQPSSLFHLPSFNQALSKSPLPALLTPGLLSILWPSQCSASPFLHSSPPQGRVTFLKPRKPVGNLQVSAQSFCMSCNAPYLHPLPIFSFLNTYALQRSSKHCYLQGVWVRSTTLWLILTFYSFSMVHIFILSVPFMISLFKSSWKVK